MPRFITNLWFDTEAHEAAEYYCAVFPNSEITRIAHSTEAGPGEPGAVMTVDFSLDDKPFTAINGGPHFTFNEAVSLLIDCADQHEVDHYWDTLSADGGEPGPCGWLKDRYGFSWQVCPDELADEQDRHRRGQSCGGRLSNISIAMAHPDLRAVDDLCQLVLAAQRLGCTVRLEGATDEVRSLLDLAGVGDVLFGERIDIDTNGADPR